jgi:hypothetical protein
MTDAEPATAIGAERAVIGAAMQSALALREARTVVTVSDFWTPANQILFAICCDLADAGTTVDPMVVLAELERRGDATRVGGAPYLHTLYAIPTVAANAAHYAAQVRASARRRALVSVGQRLCQIAADVTDLDDALTAAARESITLDLLIDEKLDGPVQGLSTWDEFLAPPDRPEDWIVPGLLERMNVVMILARGGSGKSWLSRQMCLAISAGVHPFQPKMKIEPQSTLLIDLENTPSMVRRQTRPLASTLARLGDWSPERAHIWASPQGINIRKHSDAQLLERVIAQTMPRFVAIGSLWNLAQRGGDDWDTTAEETIAVLNRMRERYRCAFWIEHHMPKGAENKTPYGASTWERFVEYGRVIDRKGPNVWELESTFRTDRDVREWPAGMFRGGSLPWSPIFDQEELDMRIADGGPLR